MNYRLLRFSNLFISIFVLSASFLQAQGAFTLQKNFQWSTDPYKRVSPSNSTVTEVWNLENCAHSDEFPTLPIFSESFALDARANVSVEIVSVQWEPFAKKPAPEDALLTENLWIRTSVDKVKNQYFGRVKVVPVRKVGNSFERAVAFTLNVRTTPEAEPLGASDRGGPQTYTSALSDGDIYKFGIQKSGIYKLDLNFLKNELKISNIESIDPRTIKLYGNGGLMLNEKTDVERPDDLLENAIEIVGESDGKFDANDYILFYAVGPAPWIYRASTTDPELTVRPNLYDTHAYYFVKISSGNGKRLEAQNSIDAGAYESREFDDVRRLEEDKVNLLDENTSTQGSGKRFFGDYFFQTRSSDYSSAFVFKNVIAGAPARLRAEFAGRSGASSSVKITAEGTVFSKNIDAANVSDNESAYAKNALITGAFTTPDDNLSVRLDYPATAAQSEGWLDYIEVNVRRALTFDGSYMEFRDLKSMGYDATTFRLSGAANNVHIWDISTPSSAKLQSTVLSGSEQAFNVATLGVLKNFIAVKTDGSFEKPEKVIGKIPNQNVHGLDNLHFAIVYHPDFEEAAEKLAEHRRTYSQLDVATVNVEQLYNEFSSGAKDPTAIRDLAKMLLERNIKFDYLLLLGDGSFDPRNNLAAEEDQDFVPVFETYESYDPIRAHPSDDYFALLNNGEGGALDGGLDIAVGRLPVNTLTEANAVVDKIIAYDNTAETLGDWHLRLLYVADDEDNNAHINQADKLAIAAENTEKWFNSEKIYLDAYQQVATSAGQRFPDAKAAINTNIFKGSLLLQYIGHGGPRGWAQERVTDLADIASWENKYRNPFIITATCTFGGYDDPFTVSGGELALNRAVTGAVGLFTTVRPVYIDGNNRLTDAIQSVIFQRKNGQYRTVGDILKDGKNTLTNSNEDNARRFTLLGDPAMYLALPEYRIATTKINGNPINPAQPDTLKALSLAKIEGIVTDTAGNRLTNFNGRIFMTVFDKKQTISTLGQDPNSIIKAFTVQRNVLFKGSAKVVNGVWSIEFNVPKDINYAYGAGKLSYYAEDGTPLDAAGTDVSSVVVGGNSGEIKDDTPPLVRVYLNTDAFVSGGITNNNPKILVKCEDDYGMNVTGSSLGHDLVAIIDDNVQESVVLNDFYESEQDSYRKGKALYPLRNLAPGKHTIRVKGWDIANNSGEGYTEFIVTEDGKTSLDHVLNYPNPFTSNTYFQFEHNLSGSTLDVQVSIFTVAGKLVKTILHQSAEEGFRVNNIAWDGKDEYGDKLGKGVYLYRVKVRGTDAEGKQVTTESKFEKLTIL